jgi:hypothetical protein
VTAADLIQRAEARAARVRLSSSALRVLVIVLVIVGVYLRGHADGRASEALVGIDAQLDTNSIHLAAAVHRREATKAEATKQTTASTAERVKTRTAQAKVRIVDDSTVETIAVLPAGAALIRDTIVPPLVVAELRQDRVQINQDEITIAALKADNLALQDIVLDQGDRITLMTERAEVGEHSAFWRGVKWGAVGVVTLGTIVIHFLR